MIDNSERAEIIRKGLRKYAPRDFVMEALDKRGTIGASLHWQVPGELARVSFSTIYEFSFRELVPFEGPHSLGFQRGSLAFGGVFIRFCVRRWYTITPLKRSNPLGNLKSKVDVGLNLAIEQINYSDNGQDAIPNLDQDDIERVARIIRRCMTDILNEWRKWVEHYDRFVDGYSARKVSTHLVENWRAPLEPIQALNEKLYSYGRSFSIDRLIDGPLDDYEYVRGFRRTAHPKDNRAVTVELPWYDREDPSHSEARVQLEGVSIPFRVEEFLEGPISKPFKDSHGQEVNTVILNVIVSPFSELLVAHYGHSRDLNVSTFNRAVEHLRKAWLPYSNSQAIEMSLPQRTDLLVI